MFEVTKRGDATEERYYPRLEKDDRNSEED